MHQNMPPKNHSKIICFVAGKSGGHILPCLTIAQNKLKHEPLHILFFSSNTDLDKKIISQDSHVSWHVMLPLATRQKGLIRTFFDTCVSFFISFFYLCNYRPTEIITTGGIVAIPTCLAGWLLRIPITLYSLDAVPGKAIRFLIPYATSIITCFTNAQHYFPAHKRTIRSYPVKYTNKAIDKVHALSALGLDPDKKTIVLLGGSQGSLFLNDCMKQLVNMSHHDFRTMQIIHQTGSVDATDWKDFYTQRNISAYVFSYMPHLERIYASADLIICRAGAGTLFEIKFFNKPCIIIPLQTNTTTHQIDNARTMSSEYPELFSMIKQNEIEKDIHVLGEKIREHLSHHNSDSTRLGAI
jgi:UDP-N-acetylglucosamine--N-acetylmuramyl-(pentapeptide) pyrophosphoryl-undecaprenol N-acetylglucosamine transferase